MNKELSKAFILLDALFGVALMIAVMLLCGYFRQMAGGFYGVSADWRALAHAYYAAADPIKLDTTLLFTQAATDVVIRRQGMLNVVCGKGACASTCLVVSSVIPAFEPGSNPHRLS